MQKFLCASALLCLLSPIFSAPPPSSCNNKDVPNAQVPLYRVGDIGRDLPRSCDVDIKNKLHRCHIEYLEKVKITYVEAKCYDGAESVKKTMCCSLWEAKQCMIRASENTESCKSANITALYRQLPIHQSEREHLADQCSEYRESSPVCEPMYSPGMSLSTFTILLLMMIAIPFVIVGALKVKEFYEAHKAAQTEENEEPLQMNSLNSDIALQKTEYHDDPKPKKVEFDVPKDDSEQAPPKEEKLDDVDKQ